MLVDDLLKCVGIVRGEHRDDVSAKAEGKSDGLSRTPRIEVCPMLEVSRAPDAALAPKTVSANRSSERIEAYGIRLVPQGK
jgi:hypothetical protein